MKISEINATDGFTSQKDTRLHGHWLAVAWVGWSILTLLSLIDFMSSIHEYLGDVQVLCRPGSCLEGQPTQESAQVLHQLRLSVTAYAALGVGLVIISALVCCAVAAVIVWRKPRDWMALLVSITLITQGLYEDNYLPSIFDNPSSPWNIVGLMLGYLAPVLVLFSVAFFPNGRPVPRWIGWLLAVICLIDLPPSLFPSMLYGGLIETLFVLSGFPLIVGSLIYRYRRVSTPLERQQIKWVVFGITLAMVAFMGWFIPQIFLFSSLSPHGSVYDLFGHPLLVLSELSIPLCIGFAVLRYHLWDIDVIINKALVYGTLTTILALVYIGLILALQYLLRELINQNSSVAIVISTLVIAALFQPLRRRIQQIIDRRFYRRKYDAAKTIAAFSITLRNEVDLNQLREHLITVVQDTMQPSSVSLWLRKPDSKVSHPDRLPPDQLSL
jgi:hypothetical protein